MKILLIGDFLFPYGSAGASRIKNLARSLYEAGSSVRVIFFQKLKENKLQPINSERFIHGFPYESVLGFAETQKSESLPLRYFHMLQASIAAKKRVSELIDRGDVDAIIVYGWDSLQIEPVIRLARHRHIKVLADIVESPSSFAFRGGIINPLYWSSQRLYNKIYFLLDGVISISSYIEDKYKPHVKKVLRVPALVDPNLYEKSGDNVPVSSAFQLVYLGSFAKKDDPWTMMNAIKLLVQEGYLINFTIIGTKGENGLARQIMKSCEDVPQIGKSVRFLGRIPDVELKTTINTASALILPRLEAASCLAAFPTRLPELLLTGKPVITTDVGDLSDYLENGVDAILVAPGNPIKMKDSIIELLGSEIKRQQIGGCGREKALKYFSYNNYGETILSFINSL
jgi:glycosyltransferase involved in cell wall biosynthesis